MEKFLEHPLFQFIQYALIGGMNVLIDFAILNLCSYITGITKGWPLVIFNVISFAAYSTNGYFFNRKFTFKTEGNFHTYIKYVSVLGIGMILNSFLLLMLTRKNFLLIWNPSIPLQKSNRIWMNISKLIASMTTGILSFLINKFVVFKKVQA